MNSICKFIDSCVSRIAETIQDEFDETKHPRDNDGKFSSGSGGESKKSTAPEDKRKLKNYVNRAYNAVWRKYNNDTVTDFLKEMGVDISSWDPDEMGYNWGWAINQEIKRSIKRNPEKAGKILGMEYK